MLFKGIVSRVAVAAMAAALVATSAIGARAADQSVINVYSAGDTNITDWLQNIVIPAFEKEYPQYKVTFTNSRASGDQVIVDRAVAALATGDDPQVEVMDLDPRSYKDATAADLWYKPSVKDIPNLANITAAAQITDLAASYRGSQVLIAYNSENIKAEDVPTTFAELLTWIKANPGKFVYCRPDKGGSGGYFMVRALYEVSGKKPELFQGAVADQKLMDEYYPKALALLKDLSPSIYDNGAYPAGNKPVLALLAEGEVDMISAWSDQAIEAIRKEQVPASVKLLQFSDLPMPGGYTSLAVPKNAKNLKGAQDFVNYLLSVEGQTSVVSVVGGFPVIGWDKLPTDLQEQFNSVITETVPLWPGGEWGAPLVKGWYEQVAPNIDPKSS